MRFNFIFSVRMSLTRSTSDTYNKNSVFECTDGVNRTNAATEPYFVECGLVLGDLLCVWKYYLCGFAAFFKIKDKIYFKWVQKIVHGMECMPTT